MLTRTEIIQKVIDTIDAQTYVEIGVGTGKNFNDIRCARKISVDPCNSDYAAQQKKKQLVVNFEMTSDEFFAQNTECFDVFFIDGLHVAEQVSRDIDNALRFLNDCGYIICHDMHPKNKKMQQVPRIQKTWTGDCWRAFVKLRATRADLFMAVIDTDFGVGLIRHGAQTPLTLKHEPTYEEFDKNKTSWLNLVSTATFTQFFPALPVATNV
jgi:hypothetical protein